MYSENQYNNQNQPAEEIVIVVGNTGAGKSTLINYLAGAKLKSVGKKYPIGFLLETEKQVGDIKIVHGAAQGTSIPDKYFDEKTGITYFDCPGYTQYSDGKIINNFYIHNLFEISKKLKIVAKLKIMVIASRSDIGDNMQQFLELINKIAILSPNLEGLIQNTALIISKSSQDIAEDPLKQYLNEFLSENALNDYINDNQRLFIRHFSEPEAKVAFFSQPTQIGDIGSEEAISILDKIKSTPCVEHEAINLLMSHLNNILQNPLHKSPDTIVDIRALSILLKYYKDALSGGINIPNNLQETIGAEKYHQTVSRMEQISADLLDPLRDKIEAKICEGHEIIKAVLAIQFHRTSAFNGFKRYEVIKDMLSEMDTDTAISSYENLLLKQAYPIYQQIDEHLKALKDLMDNHGDNPKYQILLLQALSQFASIMPSSLEKLSINPEALKQKYLELLAEPANSEDQQMLEVTHDLDELDVFDVDVIGQ
jgi:GTP-binding protein EngB required for normal cell division